MTMLARKICMIGDFAVGKTSLIARYAHNQFSEKYQASIGVKIDTKELRLASGDAVKLVLWDIAGTDELNSVGQNYLKGAAGYILVVDGTRLATFGTAISLQKEVERRLGPTPFTLILNKLDLSNQWALNADAVQALQARGWQLTHCSAKKGNGVEQAFQLLGERMVIGVRP